MSELKISEKKTALTPQSEPIPYTNGISVLMSISGWTILIVGIIIGLYQSKELSGEVQFLVVLSYSFPALSTGLILVGISEVVRLLHRHLAVKTGYSDQ
ncbi:hypothetical protein PAT3040_04108 [Paenibacillus agaridevorans]|uniref:Uncharacterized protein n=1 Tax=Paenibacillus agaridevorans TaxID=171404 RepID=A0A2R5ERZ7_9BACL|nr:hypothetical protein PAT3040_04108 [Paenibacillus agaridevorans]